MGGLKGRTVFETVRRQELQVYPLNDRRSEEQGALPVPDVEAQT